MSAPPNDAARFIRSGWAVNKSGFLLFFRASFGLAGSQWIDSELLKTSPEFVSSNAAAILGDNKAVKAASFSVDGCTLVTVSFS